MSGMPQQLSRILALLLLIFFIAVFIGFIVMPVWSLNNKYTDELSTIKNRIEIMERTTAIGESIKNQLNKFSRWETGNRHNLASQSEALAGAELQRITKASIVQKGGEVLSSQIISTSQEGGFSRVTIRVSMKGSLETLVAVFYELEAGNIYLLLDDVSIHARPTASRRRGKSKKINTPRPLDIKFELSSYFRESQS